MNSTDEHGFQLLLWKENCYSQHLIEGQSQASDLVVDNGLACSEMAPGSKLMCFETARD
jgi:hypothetical protein